MPVSKSPLQENAKDSSANALQPEESASPACSRRKALSTEKTTERKSSAQRCKSGREIDELALSKVPGISLKRSQLFEKLGIHNQRELLFYYPRAYDDWTKLSSFAEFRENETLTFRAKVASSPQLMRHGRLSWVKCKLSDGVDFLDATWFNQSWMQKNLHLGEEYIFHGKIKWGRSRPQIVNPWYATPGQVEGQGILALYPLTQGLTQKLLRSALDSILNSGLASQVSDPLPDEIRRHYKLCTADFALHRIHQPRQQEDIAAARRRLAFEELYLTRAAMQLARDQRLTRCKAPAMVTNALAREKLQKLRESLPFSLTNAQLQAINDILRDLRLERPMNRLLQGDVGSGKTLVAAFAMLYCACCGAQSVLMAPTSILAEQHYKNLSSLFSPVEVEVGLLTAATTATERARLLDDLGEGRLKILVGTHALLQEDLKFQNLALTVTDEQHRFGVRQRSLLGQQATEDKGFEPHRLVMSATPIPRTLALIVYGDLDLSIMREMPLGRREIKTYTATSGDLPRVYELMRREISQGAQVYVVCPLIEDSELMPLDSAEESYKRLQKDIFRDCRVALLHGQIKADEKEQTMAAFMRGDIQILVSTTVVEVGVDNPNASLMLIMNAERFGLAQLHQLRGRVGRGERQSFCILHSDQRDGLAAERLKTLCHHSDGFELAEADLRLRGPGDFFGTKQHGLPSFRLLNLYEDTDLIAEVGEAVDLAFKAEGPLRREAMERVRAALSERYPELLQGFRL